MVVLEIRSNFAISYWLRVKFLIQNNPYCKTRSLEGELLMQGHDFYCTIFNPCIKNQHKISCSLPSFLIRNCSRCYSKIILSNNINMKLSTFISKFTETFKKISWMHCSSIISHLNTFKVNFLPYADKYFSSQQKYSISLNCKTEYYSY